MKTLASLAAVLALAAAGSASAQEARIAWGDLDMSSAAGANTFDARVEAAARSLCRGAKKPGSRISDRAFCRAAVQAEAVRLLPGPVQVDYALSRLPLVA
ncbi:MAG: UrcA family protein [Brevundimonas sp.]|uniref:UrcA family protein n=1 Tax=Brevundimonas sp. TaxID=1871086 RepID=UPI002489A67B|nr:UrcA family protein [Brevundimonas sp.]MDI1327972.1 UrcA family protein [Brevundimonas sp.]